MIGRTKGTRTDRPSRDGDRKQRPAGCLVEALDDPESRLAGGVLADPSLELMAVVVLLRPRGDLRLGDAEVPPARAAAASSPSTSSNRKSQRAPCGRTAARSSGAGAPRPRRQKSRAPVTNRSGKSVALSTDTLAREAVRAPDDSDHQERSGIGRHGVTEEGAQRGGRWRPPWAERESASVCSS